MELEIRAKIGNAALFQIVRADLSTLADVISFITPVGDFILG